MPKPMKGEVGEARLLTNPAPALVNIVKGAGRVLGAGKNPLEYLDKLLQTVEINRVEEPLESSPNIRYYRKDYNLSNLLCS